MVDQLMVLQMAENRFFDPGPPLAYPLLCSAYTVEKMSLWLHSTENKFETISIKAPGHPQARIEGHLYRMTDAELFALDSDKQLGVQFVRKRIPVYTPFYNNGKMEKVFAWVYIGLNSHWLDPIAYGTSNLRQRPPFQLADRYPDNDRVLHQRFSCLPPLLEAPANTRYDFNHDRIRKHCKKRNRSEMRRLFFSRFLDDEL